MSGTGQVFAAPRASVAVFERLDGPVPYVGISNPGPARAHNEDRWQVDEAHSVFVLADGMGGYNAGEVASEIAVRTVAELVGALRDSGLGVQDALVRAVAAAHANILEFAHARPECLGMGTTLVAAAFADGGLTLAHVGDSRAYRLRDGQLERLTRDHSLGQQMLDSGGLTEAQLNRLPARGILTRALGVEHETAQPDVARFDWRDDDLLLLCSDGLTDSLDDAAIGRILAPPGPQSVPAGTPADATAAHAAPAHAAPAHAAPAHAAPANATPTCAGSAQPCPLSDVAQRLIASAQAGGGADDVTVLLAGGWHRGLASH